MNYHDFQMIELQSNLRTTLLFRPDDAIDGFILILILKAYHVYIFVLEHFQLLRHEIKN